MIYHENKKDTIVVLITGDQFKLPVYISHHTLVQVYQVSSVHKIFPALWLHKPDTLIIDYEFLQKEAENVIRRIRTNSFYNNIKICCLKKTSNYKTDEFLKVIGVDYLIYKSDSMYPYSIS